MRQVTLDGVSNDAPELARLIRLVWAHHNPDPARIARVSLESNHATLVETEEDELIGFVDAFSTVAMDGTLRWEVDLLGVHPLWRGRGVAQRLIRRITEIGRERGAQIARALVRTDNTASQKAFERCGFVTHQGICGLYISDEVETRALALPADAYLLTVSTLIYSGVWIEGAQTELALCFAQVIRTRFGWDVAGAVIPSPTANVEGYEYEGSFRWLVHKYAT